MLVEAERHANAIEMPPIDRLVADARSASRKLAGTFPGKPTFVTTSLKQGRRTCERITELTGLAEDLISATPEKAASACERAKSLFPRELANNPTQQKIKEVIQHELVSVTNVAHNLRDTHKNDWKALRKKKKGGKSAGHDAEGESWLGKAFGKHTEWLEKKSPETALAIALGEITIGGILTSIGGQWLSQSISGLEQKQMNQASAAQDGRQITSSTLVMEPMPATDRLLRGVVGGAVTAAGLGGSILGWTTLFRGR